MAFELLGQSNDARNLVAEVGFFYRNAGRIGSKSCDQTGSRRVARRILAIGSVEKQPAGRQSVDIRGVYLFVAVYPELRPQIVDRE